MASIEQIKDTLGCKCKKCFLRNSVYGETLDYLNKTFPKKKTIDKLPFLHFRLFSPNLTLGQALSAFDFNDEETQ